MLNYTSEYGKTITNYGGTLVFDENGGVSGSGTPTGATSTSQIRIDHLSGKYTLSASGAFANMVCAFCLYDKNDKILLITSVSDTTQSVSIDTTLYPAFSYAKFEIKRRANDTEMNGTAYFQLEKGTVATDYAPYANVSGIALRATGKNLMCLSGGEQSGEVNGVGYTVNTDGSITLSGTAAATGNIWLASELNYALTSGSYTLSGAYNDGTNKLFVCVRTYDAEKNTKLTTCSGAATSVTVEAGASIRDFSLYMSKDSVYNNITIFPQLEPGDTATDFEPPIAPVEYTPNADGTVEGVTSVYPTTVLMSDTENVVIEAEYNRDLNKAFDEVYQMIANIM